MIAIFDIDSLIYEACYNADEFQEAADKFFNKYNDAIYNLNGRSITFIVKWWKGTRLIM
jgi:hypothetical protein